METNGHEKNRRLDARGGAAGLRRAWLVGGVLVALLTLVALAVSLRSRTPAADPKAEPSMAADPATTPAVAEEQRQGLLYGRVTTVLGTLYQGRLRFGAEEAFWTDYFNGTKASNPWARHVPPERLRERRPLVLFGWKIAERVSSIELGRPFMAHFGDLARIEARGDELRAILKSGSVVELDRFGADDLADGLRVWDERQGMVDLDEWSIAKVEFLPTPPLKADAERLYGSVRSGQGDFKGYLQWDRQHGLGSDMLKGRGHEGELAIRFDAIRSIARAAGRCRLSLLDGRELELSGQRGAYCTHRGIFVDDPRYGRVLVTPEAFESADLRVAGDGGPAYGYFPPGRPLTATVITRAGRRLTGRLVYDLDESETTDTLDAPRQGISYSLPFGLIALIAPASAVGSPSLVILRSGEELLLESAGDLGPANAGLLVFVEEGGPPEHVPWTDVEQIDLSSGPALVPSL
jgi:hypothetical protein